MKADPRKVAKAVRRYRSGLSMRDACAGLCSRSTLARAMDEMNEPRRSRTARTPREERCAVETYEAWAAGKSTAQIAREQGIRRSRVYQRVQIGKSIVLDRRVANLVAKSML